ncbi:hypothetical protein [Streptomyces botrytidirepellens]|uniref:Uncharacterized protein n=1 Tax=Streptomyces botrytidirepellens TaxID=2486417 RepID=A0A3M8UHG6_9ACTN|nr:hypothetical protein [Streptomyces botrytidirepellens]RNG04744.1 hypothetical protein EEJ42_33915 [Streptomyces botrytidirepellens]
MSDQTERDTLGELLFREFNAYATALTEHGEDWAQAWPSTTWPPHTPLLALQGRFAVAREAAAAIGVEPSDSQITEEHRARLEYQALFPDGAPTLIG